jgi:hypothetical protein
MFEPEVDCVLGGEKRKRDPSGMDERGEEGQAHRLLKFANSVIVGT